MRTVRLLVILGICAAVALVATVVLRWPRPRPPAAAGPTDVATGISHSCAVTSAGGLRCWGFNGFGGLGDGTITDRQTPVSVFGLNSGVADVALGYGHSCALTTAGAVQCWGLNDLGQLGDGTTTERHVPANVIGLSNGVVAITAGYSHTCALLNSGRVRCWGDNSIGQLGDGTASNPSAPVEVCASGSGPGCAGGAPLAGVTAIGAGDFHTCAVTTGGALTCWGWNEYGQMGDNTAGDGNPFTADNVRTNPVNVFGLGSGVAQVSAGDGHTCARMADGGVRCWGLNNFGQLGDGSTANRLTPVVIALTNVADVEVGQFHSCARTTAGGVKCWGYNDVGRVGDGTMGNIRTTPTDVVGLSSGVERLSSGGGHSCALAPAGVLCWGWNFFWQLGNHSVANTSAPVGVVGLSLSVAGGGNHTCALTAAGGVKCWGANNLGQLGDGTTTQRTTPVDVSGLTSGVAAVAAGIAHTCALITAGGVKCWGYNSHGQLGDGTNTARTAPVDVSGLTSGVVQIAAGDRHTCALTTTGGVKCWGLNNGGQLGDGTNTARTTPVDVSGLTSGVAQIAAGRDHTCALTTAGGVKCWGYNEYGQLGDGTAGDGDPFTLDNVRTTPVDVSGLTSGVAQIAAGGSHTCALTTAGVVRCWGDNEFGQLGDGMSGKNHGVPRLVCQSFENNLCILLSGVDQVVAGDFHACALITSGGVKCWGLNNFSQLGDGTTTNRATPVDVSGLGSGVAAVSAGGSHTCAVTTAGGVKCWGDNLAGQLGDGTTTGRTTPADVVGLSPKPGGGDTDGDGCTDEQENGPNPANGGGRDYLNFWDFFDTPDPNNQRDRIVSVGDVQRIVQRFGSTGSPASNPLIAPPPSGYHTAFDRSAPLMGADPWDLNAPDGSITAGDILFAVRQFGHTCVV